MAVAAADEERIARRVEGQRLAAERKAHAIDGLAGRRNPPRFERSTNYSNGNEMGPCWRIGVVVVVVAPSRTIALTEAVGY